MLLHPVDRMMFLFQSYPIEASSNVSSRSQLLCRGCPLPVLRHRYFPGGNSHLDYSGHHHPHIVRAERRSDDSAGTLPRIALVYQEPGAQASNYGSTKQTLPEGRIEGKSWKS